MSPKLETPEVGFHRHPEEKRELEQYFFDDSTLEKLEGIVEKGGFRKIACLGVPTLAARLESRGKDVTLLDLDTRWASHLEDFKEWDIKKPSYLQEEFDLIICDPPFFDVGLAQLRQALKILSHFNPSQKILVSYLVRRSGTFLRSLRFFNLRETGFFPTYSGIPRTRKNDVQFFANFPVEETKKR